MKAVADGEVVFSGSLKGYGKTVKIKHAKYETLYGHLNRIDVKVGDGIKQGESLGLVGETGNATRPHLHFEVRTHEGEQVNPRKILPF